MYTATFHESRQNVGFNFSHFAHKSGDVTNFYYSRM